MRLEKRYIYEKGEYTHPGTYGFCPSIVPYIHEDGIRRPGVLVVPGGAYRFCSPTEGEPVARSFYERGFQAFVITYTTNPLDISPVRRQALEDLARAVRYIRHNAEEFCLEKGKLAVCGFSAGGHAAASLCVHNDETVESNEKYREKSARPDLSILAYPVITGDGAFTHAESIDLLLGKDRTEEELLFACNEKNVKTDTTPAFIWHTFDDGTVPVRNSLEYAAALREKGVPVSLHIFTTGIHGLSTADGNSEVTSGNAYTYEPLMILMDAMLDGRIGPGDLPDPAKDIGKLERQLLRIDNDVAVREPEAQVWVDLASDWMNAMYER